MYSRNIAHSEPTNPHAYDSEARQEPTMTTPTDQSTDQSAGLDPATAMPMTVEGIAASPTTELVNRYRAAVGLIDRRLMEMADDDLDQAFLPDAGVGRWPIRVLMGHLADAEMVQIHRMRRAVAEPGAVLGLWDEHAFIDCDMYGKEGQVRSPIAGFCAMVYTTRQWAGEWLATLTDEEWQREIMHPENGAMSTRDLLVYTIWHFEHHLGFLQAKVSKLMGEEGYAPIAGPAAHAQAGGCASGGSCGCEAQGKARPADGSCCGGSSASDSGACCSSQANSAESSTS